MNLELPSDLGLALDAAGMRTVFDTMPASQRNEWLRTIDEAKRPETREPRIAECVDAMRALLAKREGRPPDAAP